MALTETPLVLMLLLGHFIADFFFQPSSWVEDRYDKHISSKYLYIHTLIHGIISYAAITLFTGINWTGFCLALIISVSHFIIDAIKSYTDQNKIGWFIADQLSHVAVIIAVWMELTNQTNLLQQLWTLLLSPKPMIGAIAYFLVINPFGILIGVTCQKWADELDDNESLKNAGKRIGQLERFLILTFILVGQFAAIGFLLAAKSVLRYGDHRKINEYILIGTMTSFSLTIAFGLLVKTIIGMF